MKDLIYLLLAAALVGLNAFFVSAEFALVKVRVTRLEEMAAEGSRLAGLLLQILQKLDAYLSACQIGITIASLGLGWVGEPAFAHLVQPLVAGMGGWSDLAAHSIAITVAFLLITFLHVILGELVPKIISIREPERISLWIAAPMRACYIILFPAIWALNGSALLIVRLFGFDSEDLGGDALSGKELKRVLSGSRAEGYLSDRQEKLLSNALDFPDHVVRQIMVPRTDVVSLDVDRPFEENFRILRQSAHTRYPLYRGDPDNIIGILHIKALLHAMEACDAPPDLQPLAHEAVFIPESLPIARLLDRFLERRVHLAVVIDEYGGTSGIVTLEDVTEELLGEIQDEFDEEAPSIVELEGGKVSIDAAMSLEELEERTGLIPEEDHEVDTVGGLVVAYLGRIARVGDRVVVGGRRIDVSRVRSRRILRVILHSPDLEEKKTEPAS